MLYLKTKWFSKWAKKHKINDKLLIIAIQQISDGAAAVKLGANLLKIRVPRKGEGKSGGFRTILLYIEEEIAVYIYGFSKSEKENLSQKELNVLKKLGRDFSALSNTEIEIALKDRILNYIGEE